MEIGSIINHANKEYIVTKIDTLEGLNNTKKRMIETGKLPMQFHAELLLDSSKKSVQGGVFLAYKDLKTFVKL